ncbi:MAG: hypothetical protein KF703_15420, partial [Actinobacteria bacterium]|nr:hypothetical protein [Actinomycetota bacterium]
MTELGDVIARCEAAAGSVLDLGDLSLGRFAHANNVALTAIAWWLLSTGNPPSEVRCVTRIQQTLLQRTGITEACRVRQIPVRVPSDPSAAAGSMTGIDWSNLNMPRPRNAAQIANLCDPLNRPPEPDEHGRRYHWIQPLIGKQDRMDRRDRDLALELPGSRGHLIL